jgi:hypothetical protein
MQGVFFFAGQAGGKFLAVIIPTAGLSYNASFLKQEEKERIFKNDTLQSRGCDSKTYHRKAEANLD